MPDWLVTLLSTLAGGAIAIVTVLLQQRSARQAEARTRRERLTTRYLFQLQDAADSLWFRLDNLGERSGATVMDAQDPLYRELTTLYALGRYLAVHRMLTLDGVWPELARLYPSVERFLRDPRLDEAWPVNLFHYDRIALGEAVLERDDQGFHTSTYLEFRRRYESDELGSREWRDRIWTRVAGLSGSRRDALLATVAGVGQILQEATGSESAAPRVARQVSSAARTSGPE